MKVSKNRPTERKGVNAARSLFEAAGCLFQEVDTRNDFGKDAYVDILREPLLHLERTGPDLYVIEAVERMTDWTHKEMVLAALPHTQRLIDVVVAKRWTQAAAPTLLRVLAERSRNLDPHWVIAAAEVAAPEHYNDLRFQVAEGQWPLEVWKVIRDLPGMEPLDAFVEKTRRKAREGYQYRWYEFAVIASHYGQRGRVAQRDDLHAHGRLAEEGRLAPPRYIINFPTKRHWRDPFRMEDIESGLPALVVEIRTRGIPSIAIPALGAGLGGLARADVKLRIENALEDMTCRRSA
jgi:hypothetical protein